MGTMEEGNRERSRVGELEHVTIVGMIMINGEMKKLNWMDWGRNLNMFSFSFSWVHPHHFSLSLSSPTIFKFFLGDIQDE